MQGIKFIPTEKQIEIIKKGYNNPFIKQTEIAKKLGINSYTLNKIANSLGLSKVRKSAWSEGEINWLKNNYELTYKEMTEALGFDSETIRLKIKELGLKRTTKYRPFKLDMTDEEFIKDLEDPTLTAPDIVFKYKDKYDIGESRIHQLRKERKIKLQVNTLARESTSEKVVREILDKLDVAYIKEKRVGRYHIDFYLGFKICVEVQGHYWHSKPSRKLTDNRKKKFLNDLGYTVIYLWDDDLENAEYILKTTLQELGLPIQ